MNKSVGARYSLVVFDTASMASQSQIELLDTYLRLYEVSIGEDYRTDKDELKNFLQEPDEGRIVVYFGLADQARPCGFATLMLYPESHLAVIDHLTVPESDRKAHGYHAFFPFCHLIKEYLEGVEQSFNYIIAEVMVGAQPMSGPSAALKLIGSFSRLNGFNVVDFPYFPAEPSIVEDKEACRAAMLLYCRPEQSEISARSLIEILRALYFKHNGDWYYHFMTATAFKSYKSAIQASFDRMEKYLTKKKIIALCEWDEVKEAFVVKPAAPAAAAAPWMTPDQVVALALGFVLLLLSLLLPNVPENSRNLILSLAFACFGKVIGGFAKVQMKKKGWAIDTGGAIGMAVLAYLLLSSPKLF